MWARENKHLNPKLHIFGKPKEMRGWGALIKRLQDDGTMGLLQGWAADLRVVYRNADCLLTAHQIDVRSVREAMACGCPVVRVSNIENSGINESLQENRMNIRRQAQRFDPKTTADQFAGILCSY